MGKAMKVNVLDHGFVKLLNIAGPIDGTVDITHCAKAARI